MIKNKYFFFGDTIHRTFQRTDKIFFGGVQKGRAGVFGRYFGEFSSSNELQDRRRC